MRYLRTEKLRSFHLRPFIVGLVGLGLGSGLGGGLDVSNTFPGGSFQPRPHFMVLTGLGLGIG